ncbi:MAG TPA: HD domain-containing phosphohydrolase [Actinomycetales bacterium]|nr:HD domain-containing phosphohydrolase [Actinomycetales bacterium]
MTSTRSPRLAPGSMLGGLALLVAVAAVGSAASTVTTSHLPHGGTVVAFGAAIALGECLRVWLTGDRDAAPMGTAAAFAFALVGEVGTSGRLGLGAPTIIAVVAVATLLGVVPHLLAGRTVALDGLAHRFLSVAVLVLGWHVHVHGVSAHDLSVGWGEERRGYIAALMALAVAAALVLDAVLAAAVRATREGSRLRSVLGDELRAVVSLGSAIGATGVLVALAARPMGVLALPVFLAPLLLTQFAFRRYAMVRETYRQTIRSLSRVTELGGYTETGHSRRVARLALAVGRDLGLSERELQDLEYAALLHDIGQLSLSEPIPGGATVMAAPGEQRRIADLGAAVVRQAGVLDDVALIVERQVEPYRRRHELNDREVPLASRIIKAVNAYDDLVGDDVGGSRSLEALERIHLGLAFEYDPVVVASLARVVTR